MPGTKTGGSTGRSRSGGALVAALALGVIALLIWSKLRLVTGIPRTAYAVPKASGGAAERPELAAGEESRTEVADGSDRATDDR